MLAISPRQCRAARVGIGLSRKELALAANLNERTIIDFERGARTPHANNLVAIKKALENAGVRFTAENCICFD